MRCRTCDHILWNQPAPADAAPRACSECGTAYRVEDFAFVPGKVEFHCPFCATAYFGTTTQGHLDPREFECVDCSHQISMESCTLVPYGVRDDRDAMLATEIPWVTTRPLMRRWWSTVKVGFGNTRQLNRMLPGAPAPARAFFFLSTVAVVSGLLSLAISLVIVVIAIFSTGPRLSAVGMFAVTIVSFILGPIFLAANAGCAAWLASLGAGKDGPRFSRAFELASYSSGPLLLSLVPFCGGLIAFIWWVVQGTIALAAAAPADRRPAVAVLAVFGFLAGGLVWAVVGFASGLLF